MGYLNHGDTDMTNDTIQENACPICKTQKTKARTDEEKRDLINRLKRIEGQVRGVQSMLEGDAYCVDIMTQAAAIGAALDSFNRLLLDTHIRTCVADSIRKGNTGVVEELIDLVRRLTK